jgi:FOG: GAF domain
VRVRRGTGLSTPTASSGGRDNAPADLNPWAALESLDTGVLVLSSDLRVLYANTAWASWLGGPVAPGTPFTALVDEGATSPVDELRAVLVDGEPRTMQLALRAAHADSYARRVTGVARRTATGLVLEARGDSEDDRDALHDVARRLAEVTDMAEVLRTLCEIAARQCQGTGAAVLRMTGNLGEVVAASGDLVPARGRCFELTGSMMGEAMSRRETVAEENFYESGRPLQRVVPELALGPVLVAPLHAHGDTLGVLAVGRAIGARPFRVRDEQRLRMLSDHAALAVHKSLLLQQAQSADRAKGASWRR